MASEPAESPIKKARTLIEADEASWTEARVELLKAEKAAARANAELALTRAKLPWLKLSTDYQFVGCDGSSKPMSCLFDSDDDELIVYHLMMDDCDKRPCSLCCFFVDQLDSVSMHLPHNVKVIVVAKAGAEALAKVVETKGWKIPVLSTGSSTFGEDMGVSFTKEQMEAKACPYNYTQNFAWGSQAPGLSVFRRHEGDLFKTYATFSAGLANVSLVHSLLDLTTTGRNEAKPKHNMWWVKHKEDL
mmetsp:Transcript_21322/g.25214  ORF Transcript_21322/g.25214 Transcript_21322/m.25214 type:complete len:246 (-) Transcript_21322:93-830(-)